MKSPLGGHLMNLKGTPSTVTARLMKQNGCWRMLKWIWKMLNWWMMMTSQVHYKMQNDANQKGVHVLPGVQEVHIVDKKSCILWRKYQRYYARGLELERWSWSARTIGLLRRRAVDVAQVWCPVHWIWIQLTTWCCCCVQWHCMYLSVCASFFLWCSVFLLQGTEILGGPIRTT